MGAGNALTTLERHAEAEPLLARARAGQKDNSPLYLAHGRVLELLGREEEAAEAYRAGVTVASRKGDLQPLREMEHRLLMLTAADPAPGARAADLPDLRLLVHPIRIEIQIARWRASGPG